MYVKQEMQCKGFLSREFSSLPNDMSSGSRELLLGFAWLLCKEALIDKFMEACASPLDEEDPSFMYEVSWKIVRDRFSDVPVTGLEFLFLFTGQCIICNVHEECT